MILEEIIPLVIEEAKNLRQHATPEEIAKLNLGKFNGGSVSNCIYGQMTGNCYTQRARDLIELCCEKVCHANGSNGVPKTEYAVLNGSPVGLNRKVNGGTMYVEFYSPIEVIVAGHEYDEWPQNVIIPYLKGESDSLDLTNPQ